MAPNDRMATEVYSFVSFLASLVAFAAWLVWVFVPDEWLQSWGIAYFPSKWWALALPTYLVTMLAFVGYAYVALCMMAVRPLGSLDLVQDSSTPASKVLYRESGRIPDIQDINLAVVNRYLYPEPEPGDALQAQPPPAAPS
mmetsp:Transcript_20810/g.65374  ORF Transcript_20810/g.65374 Transcript_20810/m.65374 type:complete len:141 (-) Transcript_20810:304-726(-)